MTTETIEQLNHMIATGDQAFPLFDKRIYESIDDNFLSKLGIKFDDWEYGALMSVLEEFRLRAIGEANDADMSRRDELFGTKKDLKKLIDTPQSLRLERINELFIELPLWSNPTNMNLVQTLAFKIAYADCVLMDDLIKNNLLTSKN